MKYRIKYFPFILILIFIPLPSSMLLLFCYCVVVKCKIWIFSILLCISCNVCVCGLNSVKYRTSLAECITVKQQIEHSFEWEQCDAAHHTHKTLFIAHKFVLSVVVSEKWSRKICILCLFADKFVLHFIGISQPFGIVR